MADEEHNNGGSNDAQSTQEQHQMDEGDHVLQHISGKQKDEEESIITNCPEDGQSTTNCKQHNYHNDQIVDSKKQDTYPGVSSQKR
eukprot:3178075-Heterocapsa_arctica.AAC.1